MGLGGGRARRLSLGAAITFAVAAVASVVGGRVTDRVSLALGVFAGLVVAGMLLSYWLDHAARSSSPADSGNGSGGEGLGSTLNDVSGIQQNIIAAAPGSIAQGALGGNIINHGDVEQPSTGTPASSHSFGDERDCKS